jgi:hypothetical protein
VSRRCAVFKFTNSFENNTDPYLLDRILRFEILTLLWKCNEIYRHELEEENREHRRGIWQILEQYFRDRKTEINVETNILADFLANGPVEFGETYFAEFESFKEAVNAFARTQNKGRFVFSENTYDTEFRDYNITLEKGTTRLVESSQGSLVPQKSNWLIGCRLWRNK